MTSAYYRKMNGYPNVYWCWGGEDEDAYRRAQFAGIEPFSYPQDDARYARYIKLLYPAQGHLSTHKLIGVIVFLTQLLLYNLLTLCICLKRFPSENRLFCSKISINRLCELQLEITFWTELWRTLFRMNSISFFSSLGIITFSSQTYFHASVFIERGCRLLSELHFIDFLCCFQNILYREDVASSFLNFSVLLMIYAILRLYGERILFLRFHTINKC